MSATLEEVQTPILSPYASLDFNQSFWYELKYLANDVAAILGDELIAVVLGGGFGRGEGCVTSTRGCEEPYNDVDLFLVTRSSSQRATKKLRLLSERYEHRLNIAVDFSRPQTPGMIARWEPLLMWQELVAGHLVLYGPQDILLRNVQPQVSQQLPMVEASRLMLNRGAGLVWAARVALGREPAPDDSFVTRNYFKCCQALGDATLITCGFYTSDPALKSTRLHNLLHGYPELQQANVLPAFAKSIAFRTNPGADYGVTTSDLRSLATQWCHLFLWLEDKRHAQTFSSIADYTKWTGLREVQRGCGIVQLAANLRRRRISRSHPRARVYRSLPKTLFQLSTESAAFNNSSCIALRHWREAS